jgi:hypothetical protein
LHRVESRPGVLHRMEIGGGAQEGNLLQGKRKTNTGVLIGGEEIRYS